VHQQAGAFLSGLGVSGGLEFGLGLGIDLQGDEECAYLFFSLFCFRFSLSVNFASFCFSFLLLSFFPFSAISPLLIHDFIRNFPFAPGRDRPDHSIRIVSVRATVTKAKTAARHRTHLSATAPLHSLRLGRNLIA